MSLLCEPQFLVDKMVSATKFDLFKKFNMFATILDLKCLLNFFFDSLIPILSGSGVSGICHCQPQFLVDLLRHKF